MRAINPFAGASPIKLRGAGGWRRRPTKSEPETGFEFKYAKRLNLPANYKNGKSPMSRNLKTQQAQKSLIKKIQQKMYLANNNIITSVGDYIFAKWIFCFWYKQLSAEFSEQISGDTVFDLGCGPGDILFALKEKYPNISFSGLDISYSVLKQAKRRLRNFKFGDISFIHMEGENLPFLSDSQSFGFSTFSFHLWRRPQTTLNQIYRVLRNDSVFVLLDFNGSEKNEHDNISYLSKISERTPFFIRNIIKSDVHWGYKIVGLYDESEFKEKIGQSLFSKFSVQTRPIEDSPDKFLIEARLYK